ncbi:MAG: hypothetical protein WCH62_03530 [Candidatus Omnitrophota bacterium]
MPTILEILGWRLFFYANENDEPTFGLKDKDKRQIRRIIFDHFDYIVEKWNEFERRK